MVPPVNRAARAANGDPSVPIHELYEVLREFGTTNFLIDHVTGSNIDNKDAAPEYGSVAKRDNARGSYSFFAQAEQPGRRVVAMRNTKPDALTPRRSPEAVRRPASGSVETSPGAAPRRTSRQGRWATRGPSWCRSACRPPPAG